jgi:hypothetical protein
MPTDQPKDKYCFKVNFVDKIRKNYYRRYVRGCGLLNVNQTRKMNCGGRNRAKSEQCKSGFVEMSRRNGDGITIIKPLVRTNVPAVGWWILRRQMM